MHQSIQTDSPCCTRRDNKVGCAKMRQHSLNLITRARISLNIAILTPVFNDWQSLKELLQRIDNLEWPTASRLRVIIVNDGSNAPWIDPFAACRFTQISAVVVIDLACNLGHQRAIALGLAVLAQEKADDLIVVMDSDGEDDPNDIARLIAAYPRQTDCVVVALRTERSEGLGFRLGYFGYRIIFRVLTGRNIRFGNFCAMGLHVAIRLAHSPNTWNHLAAALLRSNLRLVAVPTRRARRYAGTPSTNLVSLLAHGLSGLAIFSDYVFARLLLVAAVLAFTALAGILTVTSLRLFTDLAIPGWATAAVGVFALLFMQALLLFLIGALQLLANRSQADAVPARLVNIFVTGRRVITFGKS
jgi:polyisoprenyl-phosphate glycosyltransferase